jgi:penicillin amidase
VAGSKPVVLKVRESGWGPILATDGGKSLALRWIGQQPGALNFNLLELARARNLDEVFGIADHAGVPAQNLVAADTDGHIGWRLIGALPQRDGSCDPATVADEHCPAWTIAMDRSPVLTDPATHRLWTANNRVLDGAALRAVGAASGGYILGARAHQIREDLFARGHFSERDMLNIQLDDRALLLERWWQLLESKRGNGGALAQLVAAAGHWEGRAAPESVSYHLVRRWRQEVLNRIARGMLAPARRVLDKDFRMPSAMEQLEGVAWPLLEQQPAHLLPSRFASWDELLEDAARAVRTDLGNRGQLARRRWGEANRAHVCHPLAAAFPGWMGRWLCMTDDELRGDRDMPLVASPDKGASERMVVAPGHEAEGIIEMPAGQSGNPLSPFWGAGHEDWVKGNPTPFLPGTTRYTLTLRP